MLRKRKVPSAPDTVVRVPASPAIATDAPGSTAPEASVTVSSTLPVDCCAYTPRSRGRGRRRPVFVFSFVLLGGLMRLGVRSSRIAWNRSALPLARAPPEALVDELEPFQLFLECGRKNAEGFGRALLVAVRGHHHGEDEIVLEAQE